MLQHFTMLKSRQIFSGGFFVSVKTGGTGPDDLRPVSLPCYPLMDHDFPSAIPQVFLIFLSGFLPSAAVCMR